MIYVPPRRLLACLHVVAASAATALAQPAIPPARPLSFEGALAEARQNAPYFGAALARIETARARAEGATAWMPPMVGVSAMNVPAGSFNPTTADMGIRVMASQTIPWPGKRRRAANAARLAVEADDAGLGVAHRALEAEVALAYVRLTLDGQERQALAQQRELLREIADIAARRYAVGAGSQPDALRASLERTRLDVEFAALRARRAEDTRALIVLLSRTTTGADTLALGTPLDSLVARLERVQPADGTPQLSETRLEFRVSEARQTAALARLDAVRHSLRPDVTVSAEYAIVRKPFGMDGQDTWTAGVVVSVPIAPWSRRGQQAEEAAWTYELQALREEARGLTQRVEAEAAAVAEQVAAARDVVRTYERDLMPQAETAYRATLRAYAVGAGDLTALLDARRTLADLRRTIDVVRARYAESLIRSAQAQGMSLMPDSTR